jgi:DNA-binding NarL/FixJ family response regulator
MTDLIRVLVVDDHPVVCDGLSAILGTQPDFDVVGTAATGTAALREVAARHPDVVLMDLQLPELDGIAATAAIRDRHPGVRVVVLTSYDTDADILAAIEAGATGYLLKDASRQELARAVHAAARGETVLAPPVAARLISHVRGAPGPTLTAREAEVLRRVALGQSNPDIGRALYIGEATVKSHVMRIFDKLGVRDRTAAVTTAIARGILPTPL